MARAAWWWRAPLLLCAAGTLASEDGWRRSGAPMPGSAGARAVDTMGDYVSAPDGLSGYRVHRVRPAVDGRRGRGDPRYGPSSDHNFDADHDLAPTNPRNAWALHHASALGDVDEVFRLLAGCKLSQVRNCNRTADGVNPDAKESAFGKTALHRAAEHDRYDVAVELLKYNASVNVTDKYYWTPLHKTAEKGWLEMTRLLIAHGADVGATDKYGWTALHRACANGRLQVAQLLAAHGADLEHGRASLGHFAPDFHAYANQDGTPLHAAAMSGHTEVVEWLVRSGADMNARDKFGRVPLHRAAEAGQLSAATALVQLGAQKNPRGLSGGTPLAIARANGHLAVAEALARAGCTFTTPLGSGLRSGLPTQSQDYSFAPNSEYIAPRYGGNGYRYDQQPSDIYMMREQPGLPSTSMSGLVDESTGLPYEDEQHIAPEIWVPGATDSRPRAGAENTYYHRGRVIDASTDISPGSMSPHILHSSSATDSGMIGDVQVHPGAPHIDDGYRSGSYRPDTDAQGFTSGGLDAISRSESRAAQGSPSPGMEIAPSSETVRGRRLAAELKERLRLHVTKTHRGDQ